MANEIDVVSGGTAIATSKPAFSLKSLNLTKTCPAVVVAATGSKLSKYPFPKLKFEEGRRCRLAILTEDVIMIKTHYHPEVGSIICDGTACCKYCDKISIKYCYPCIVYETDNSGRVVSTKIEPRLLVLGGEMYDQISLLSEIGGSITNMDLLFSCTSTQYQKCQVTQAGPASWLNSEEHVKYMTEYMENNGAKILDAMGRTYTADELAIKLGDPNNPVTDQKVISPDAINDIYNVR
jgi:hypothetical protein